MHLRRAYRALYDAFRQAFSAAVEALRNRRLEAHFPSLAFRPSLPPLDFEDGTCHPPGPASALAANAPSVPSAITVCPQSGRDLDAAGAAGPAGCVEQGVLHQEHQPHSDDGEVEAPQLECEGTHRQSHGGGQTSGG